MKTIGLVYGVWDMFHYGHIRFLREADYLCNELIVGVLSDELATRWKRKPIMNQVERIKNLQAYGYEKNQVFLIEEDNYEIVMKLFRPDLVIHGDDNKNAPSIQTAKKLGIKTKIIPYTKGISTTEIIKRCKNA